jgi:hypothetical protein
VTLPELIELSLGLVFAYPWALVLLPAPRSPMVLALTTLALSAGGLTLGMMALAWVAPALLNLGVVVGIVVLIFGVGAWWLLEAQVVRGGGAGVGAVIGEARRRPVTMAAVLIALAMATLILFNAGYWPFGDQDAIDTYGRLGKYIYAHQALPTGEGLYEAYPLLVPLSYTYAHLIAGGVNEYLARLAPAALALGAMGAAYALGRATGGKGTATAGAAAALLVALTPTYTRWASAGYADLPAAFFFTMSALFAWRLYQSGRARDAALAGVMAGLAAWTKNGALVLVASLPAWAAYTHLRPRLWPGAAGDDGEAHPITARRAALMLGAMALVVGPWYVRNLALFGVLIPPTGWTWLAERTLGNLVPFLTYPNVYFVPGIVFTVGIAASLWGAARGRAGAALLVIFAGPLFAVWWALFSYETRFLLLILPLVAAMGGRAAEAGLTWLKWRVPNRRWVRWAAILTLAALALPAARKAVLFKDEILHNPLMSDGEKHRLQTGPAFAIGAFLDTLPASGRALSTVRYVGYYVNTDTEVVFDPPTRQGFDYWVLAPGETVEEPPGELLTEIEGARVYAVTSDE